MEQRNLFLIVFLLCLLFLIFFSYKFLPLLSASLIASQGRDFLFTLQEISQKLDHISALLENLNSKFETPKVDSSPISQKNPNLKSEVRQENQNTSQEGEKGKRESTIVASKTQEREIKTKPEISLSLLQKEFFPDEEFEVSFLAENFEEKSYDLKISVEHEGKVLSQIFNESEKKWQSSFYYLKDAFKGPSFSGKFKLKIISQNISGNVEIKAEVRVSGTTNLIATTSEKITIKQSIQGITQAQPQTPLPSPETQKECIDINTASLEELDKIYGVNATTAQKIIEARPFSSVDDLIRVKGIGEITLQKIKEQGLACVK